MIPRTPSRLTREVVRIALRARVLRLVAAAATTAAVLLACMLAAALLDAAFRFPWFVRVAALACIVIVFWTALRRRMLPAWAFRPTPVELALRIERIRPELRGRLAAAVEFDLGGEARTSVLAARAVDDAAERSMGADLAGILRRGPAASSVTLFLLVSVAVAGLVALDPGSASIAARRLLLPLSDVRWPSRTAVESLVADGSVAAKGRPFALRAKLVAGDASRERVRASYRVVDGTSGPGMRAQGAGPWIEVVLARQPSGEFERIVDASGEAIEFRFLTDDAETDTMRVALVDPPAVVEARLRVDPPAYAAHSLAAREEDLGSGLDARAVVREPVLAGSLVRLEVRLNRPVPLGAGASSARARVVAGGKTVDGLDVGDAGGDGGAVGAAGTPQADGQGGAGGMGDAGGAGAVLMPEGGASGEVGGRAAAEVPVRLVIDAEDPARWTFTGIASGATRIELSLRDEHGIGQDDPAAFSFEVVEDRAPTTTVVEPAADESMVADAKVPVRTEARDDIALKSVGIECATRMGSRAGSSADGTDGLVFEDGRALAGTGARGGPVGEPGVVVAQTGPVSGVFETTLDLAKLSLQPGDSVVVRGYAEDDFARDPAAAERTGLTEGVDRRVEPQADAGDRQPGRSRSAPRIIRIVGEDEFERQVRAMLGGARREAIRIDERQAKAKESVERDASDPGIAETQGSLTESLGRLEDSLRQALDRLERNDRDEGVMGDLARQALEIAETARAKSSESSAALSEAEASPADSQRETAVRKAVAAQEEVRQELEDLVALLDRDEDSWIARRRIDALAERVRQSARETGQAASRSGGESREELSAEARAEIDALAERQDAAGSEAEQLASELRERAKELADADRPQAEALEKAAQSIENGRVREELEQAAEEARENRLAQSKSAQDRAAAALAQASQALSEDRKVRADELARELEELTDSIKRLIEQTEPVAADVGTVTDAQGAEAEVERDAVARGAGQVSQNARGVAQDARTMSREAARAARFVEDGARSLAGAATGLRAERFVRDDVAASVASALEAFASALEAAEAATDRAEERAAEEKREELLAKYRGLLERQVGVKASVEKIVPQDRRPLGRRDAIESRRLGIVQEELRTEIASVRDGEEAVRDSDALAEIHDVIDAALDEARKSLADARPQDAVEPESEAVEALSFLVEALDESSEQREEDRFGEQQQGPQGAGGGEGAQQGPVPPVAEIKILRSMQRSLAGRTKALSEQYDSMDPVVRAQQIAELAARQQRIIELASKIAAKLGAGPGVKAGPGGFEQRDGSEQAEPPGGGGSEQPRDGMKEGGGR